MVLITVKSSVVVVLVALFVGLDGAAEAPRPKTERTKTVRATIFDALMAERR